MSRMKVYAVFLYFLHMCVHGRQVKICFRSSNESRAKTIQYDTDRPIFKVSKHIQAEMSKHANEKNAVNKKDGEPEIVLDCEENIFEITAVFLEGNIPKVEIKEKEVAGVLRLANLLGIEDGRIELYKRLANATLADEDFKKEIHKYKDVQDIKLFMLLLLRSYGSNACIEYEREKEGIDVRVCENRAILCLKREKTEGYCGSSENIEEIDKIMICSGVVSKLKSLEKDFQSLLNSFVSVANICELRIDNTYRSISTSMMICIGKMESLKTLHIHMNTYTRKLRGLKHLRGLENLVELDVSGCVLERTGKYYTSRLGCYRRVHSLHIGLSEIACLKSLKKLNIRNCKIAPGNLSCLGELETLEELDVSRNSLNRKDMLFIGGMGLTRLDLSHCKLNRGSVKLLQDMQHIKELRVASNELSEEDICAIGKMGGLVSLDLRSCRLDPGSLEHLRNLENLEEIVVSDNILDKSDLNVIGGMSSLKVLAMCDCRLLEQGELEPLVNLRCLERLYISRIRLGFDEVETINNAVDHKISEICYFNLQPVGLEPLRGMESLQVLEACSCGLQPGSLESLKGLKNLKVLNVSWNTLSKEDMDVFGNMEELTSLNVRKCCLPQGSLACIENLRKLQSLDVSANKLNKSDMIAISKINSITRLEMSMKSVYLGSLEHLKHMDNLKHLNLYRNELCGKDIGAIAYMKNLTELNISSCKVELESLFQICKSKSLRSLHVSNVMMVDKDYAVLETEFSRDVYVDK